ncbi:META domain-containing protein [Psychrobacter sp. 16-MNA-CIBAN-0192]|uniref:META domain-containing protein n=1 Tax=Psychrobacter sp. 16-MNA-CIBAN-0192 TaxID=3140448 RepID=UPI003318A29D
MTSPLQLIMLPTLLAVGLSLTACQKSDTPVDAAAIDNVETNNNANEPIADTNLADTTAVDASITPEQQLLDNLASYRWTLTSARDDDGQPLPELMTIKDQVILSFNANQGQHTVSYSVGCNTMSANYQLQGFSLTTEDSMSTKMSCQELDDAEDKLNDIMEGDSQLSIASGDTPTLTQVTDDAETLVWTGRMTSQAKYNTKGETLFWSVDANTKPCVGDSNQQCLQIKPVTYDEQGVKVSEGKLVEFAGTIEGYKHDNKHNEVLRLQRYALDATDNSATAQHAYVFDAVIESTKVK